MASPWKLGGLTSKELSRRVWREIYSGDLLTRASALSYYFLLALFPLLLFLVAVLGYFAESGTELRKNMLRYLSTVMPRTASALIHTTVDEISLNTGSGKITVGLVTALWFASYGMGAISETLNSAYGVRESRPWWKVRLSAVGLTAALAVLIIWALALVLYGGDIGEGLAARFGRGDAFTVAWKILQWPFVFACVLFALALIYYFAPDLKEQKWYWVTPGSIAGVLLWLAVSYAFRLYLHFFNSYSVTYGSLGAVIILMLWFYLTGAAILIGGQINAEIEHAAARAGTPGAKLRGEKRPVKNAD
ncbi:MAG TPA: YihY/virulence factor BrkB family protein [Pyrinomonadaceae bacterium]|jgi:membrane protein|nr:YihY/virulence factor BrkB family protein [Pyrinomonadaceae bacterium]